MSIPASDVVSVIPSIVGAGGSNALLSGLFLTQNILMPTGTVLSFANQASVSSFFGPGSLEAAKASVYFGGFTGSTQTPAAMLFSPFNLAARSAFLSGATTGITLTQLAAVTGSLDITVDGYAFAAPAVNLATYAGSYSAAATELTTVLNAGKAVGATALTVTWSSTTNSFIITSGTTGATSTIAYATGTIAATLGLTSATGATLSQGAIADTPTSAMNNVIAINQNWCGFTTLWEPVLANKQSFAAWSNAQPYYPYFYAGWDTDAQALIQGSTECFGYLIQQGNLNGVIAISGDPNLAAIAGRTLGDMLLDIATFVLGSAASVDFGAVNGRITFMFKSQPGLGVVCNNLQLKDNLIANGYSTYGQWASKANSWEFFANGAMSGEFAWLDDYIDQAWLSDQFQVADMNLLTAIKSIPYNENGYSKLRACKMDTITAALNFGAIQSGITLSNAQILEINTEAGKNVASTVQSQGYYLQILDPGPAVRNVRGTPVQNFWYTNGGAIHKLVLQSIDVM